MSIQQITNNKFPSFTEWFEMAGYKDSGKFREEDNTKRDRLEILFQEINLPYDRPERMTTRDIIDNTKLFQNIVKRKGSELCALRLVPTDPELPKYRQRGLTLNEYLNGWFKELDIDYDKYKVEVVPHIEKTLYSVTFIINDSGIFGEIITGGHWQLTQGILENDIITFTYNFNNLQTSEKNEEVQKYLTEMIGLLKIVSEKQEILKNKIKAEFTKQGFLRGYFEYSIWSQDKKYFIDYNRLLPNIIPQINMKLKNNDHELAGLCASPGIVTGNIKIVLDPTQADIKEGDILVCPMTTVDYLPLMKKCGGIITVQGSLLSHAAIISRELKKPCLIDVKDALQKLKNGDTIEMDADSRIIKILKNE